jgi:DNA-binding NarL/FixJ family response regulator
MDVTMPTMNGIEATRAIKRELPTTIVLMLSAFENPEFLLEALRAGASGYVLKHASAQQITQAIHKVLEGEFSLNHGVAVHLLRRIIEEDERSASGGERPSKDKARLGLPVLSETLSEREIAILRLMAKGQSNQQIARSLWVSVSTVKRNVKHIITALGASDRIQAIRLAIELDLNNNDL